MPTDIKLDEGEGNQVLIKANILRITASDLILDASDRRISGGFRRALVHDGHDGLTINMNGDYPGGVTIGSNLTVSNNITIENNLKVAGEIYWKSNDGTIQNLQTVADKINAIQDSLNTIEWTYIENLRTTLISLADLMGASIVPAWKTQSEVENGDDMGILYLSAEDLGLNVEYNSHQGVPEGYQHGDVLHIMPTPGTALLKGSKVVVEICLEG
ncbi:hypothetical protein ACRS42_27695 [Bacillus thuringiensis]|uniref:hypothetical protein n=1 Tax=Bacillus thuringiensis TaxID=1428 RepID=UPI003EE05FD1